MKCSQHQDGQDQDGEEQDSQDQDSQDQDLVFYWFCLLSLVFPCSHWFICNFQSFGGGFRDLFGTVLICFSGSFRSISGLNSYRKVLNKSKQTTPRLQAKKLQGLEQGTLDLFRISLKS